MYISIVGFIIFSAVLRGSSSASNKPHPGQNLQYSNYTNYFLYKCFSQHYDQIKQPTILQLDTYRLVLKCLESMFRCRPTQLTLGHVTHNAQLCGIIHLRPLYMPVVNRTSQISTLNLVSTGNVRLNITFTDFNLSWSRNCSKVSMYINDERKLFCGSLPAWSHFAATKRTVIGIWLTKHIQCRITIRYESMLETDGTVGTTLPTYVGMQNVQGGKVINVYQYPSYEHKTVAFRLFTIYSRPMDRIHVSINNLLLVPNLAELHVFDGYSIHAAEINLIIGAQDSHCSTTSFVATLMVKLHLSLQSALNFVITYEFRRNPEIVNNNILLEHSHNTSTSLNILVNKQIRMYTIQTQGNTTIDVYVQSFIHFGFYSPYCVYSGVYVSNGAYASDTSYPLCYPFFSEMDLPLQIFSSRGNTLIIVIYSLDTTLNVTLEQKQSHCSGVVVFPCKGNTIAMSDALIENVLEEKSGRCIRIIIIYDKNQDAGCHVVKMGDENSNDYYQFSIYQYNSTSVQVQQARSPECVVLTFYLKNAFHHEYAILHASNVEGRELQVKYAETNEEKVECKESALVIVTMHEKPCLTTNIYSPININYGIGLSCGTLNVGVHQQLFMLFHVPSYFNTSSYYQFRITGDYCPRCFKESYLKIFSSIEQINAHYNILHYGREWNTLNTVNVRVELTTIHCAALCKVKLVYRLREYQVVNLVGSASSGCTVVHEHYNKTYFKPTTIAETFEKAGKICEANGGQLLSYYNKEELKSFLLLSIDERCSHHLADIWSGRMIFIGLYHDIHKVFSFNSTFNGKTNSEM